jgi:bifunctional DNase/RNase
MSSIEPAVEGDIEGADLEVSGTVERSDVEVGALPEEPDARADTEADAEAEAPPDVGMDRGADAETDAPPDAEADPTADAEADPTADAEADPTVTEAAQGHEAAQGDEEPLGFHLPPAMSLMDFVDVVLTLPSTHPVVVLQETEVPYRELRIPIGGPEGIAIGYAARHMATPRPLTHELVVQLLEQFNLTLELVKITDVQGSMFTAEITVSGANGSKTLDCRPSDAIALALRHKLRVPILADPDVLDRAGGAAGGSN